MNEDVKQQIPVRSFRVTEDVMKKLKGIQDEMGLTQDGVLKLLVEGFELEQAKNAIPDRETEIANFQTKAGELVAAFLYSLQLNQDAEARIRSEFEQQLQTKDATIQNYQEQLKAAKEELTSRREQVADLTVKANTVDGLQSESAELKAQNKEKENLISLLTAKVEEAEGKAARVDSLKNEVHRLTAALTASQTALKDKEKDFEMQLERVKHASEKAQNEAVEAVRASKDETIANLNEKLSEAKIEAEKRVHSLDSAYQEELKSLMSELTASKVELARLQKKA